MAVLNVGRHIFYVVQIFSKKIADRETYEITNKELLILGLSVAFVITSLITGIYL